MTIMCHMRNIVHRDSGHMSSHVDASSTIQASEDRPRTIELLHHLLPTFSSITCFHSTDDMKRISSRRLRQRSLFFVKAIFAFLALLITPACQHVPETKQAPATSSLWSVSSDHNTVYLLGSIHVLKKENYPLHDNIYQAFDLAPHLVFEVNLDELSSPQIQLHTIKKGMYIEGHTLKDALTPENYDLVQTHLAQRGYSIEMFKLMKPWMLATTITLLELQKLGFATDFGVDQHFFLKAKTQGKTIEGLETVEYQINLFDNLSLGTQELFLLQTLKELNLLERQTHQLVESWTHGRVEGLEVMLENMQEFPEVYEALITQRNNTWLPHVESYLQKEEPYMIIVGALHLLGEKGLLAMLKEKGYVIKQL